MRLTAILSLLLITSTISWAQQADTQAPPVPINLVADHGDFNSKTNTATYTGNVDITQGEMQLKGDKVVMQLEDGKVSQIEAWGNLAYFHFIPKNGNPPIDGKGLYMIYKVPQATVDIDGKAWVKQENNETNADHLTYFLNDEHVKGQRVNMTLIPKSNNQK